MSDESRRDPEEEPLPAAGEPQPDTGPDPEPEPEAPRVDPGDDREIDRAVAAITARDPASVSTERLEQVEPRDAPSRRFRARDRLRRGVDPISSGSPDQVVSTPSAASTSTLPYIDDLRSRGWVIVVAVVIGAVFLNAMLFGAGGPLSAPRVRPESIEPFPSGETFPPFAETPATSSETPAASAEALPSEESSPSEPPEPSEPSESAAPSSPSCPPTPSESPGSS